MLADFNKSHILCDPPSTRCLHRKNIVFGTYLWSGADWSSTIFKLKVTVSFKLEYNILWMCERFWMVFEMLFLYIPVVVCPQHFLNVALLCCSLTCYVRIQVLYASNYVIWIPAFFGYMLRSCHHAHVVDSKMLLYINSNVSWGFDYIHKYFKIWNIEVGIEHMLYIHAILG
jgi:hypothetical protein